VTRPTIRSPFLAAVFAIVLSTLSGVLSAAGQPGQPLEGAFWIAPVVIGITALAALVRLEFKAPEPQE